MHTLKDVYKSYSLNSEFPLDKKIFRTLCEEFNIMAMEHLLEGGVLNLRNNMSQLSIVRIDRNYAAKTIDWGESVKYKEELLKAGEELYDSETGKGKKWFIYYTDKWYCKFYWEKNKCKVPNRSAYRFSPSRGFKGNKEKLINLLKNDDLAYLRFRKHGNL